MNEQPEQDNTETAGELSGQAEPIVITLPRHPTSEQIEAIFDLMRIRHIDSERGIELQEKHRRFETSFGLKAAAYERLIEFADKL